MEKTGDLNVVRTERATRIYWEMAVTVTLEKLYMFLSLDSNSSSVSVDPREITTKFPKRLSTNISVILQIIPQIRTVWKGISKETGFLCECINEWITPRKGKLLIRRQWVKRQNLAYAPWKKLICCYTYPGSILWSPRINMKLFYGRESWTVWLWECRLW